MKKIFYLVALLPALAFAQTYPSPTFNNLTLQTPLPAASGGTGATSATGTGSAVLSNSPSLVTPNLGTPSYLNLANATNLSASSLVSQAGNTLLGNASSSSAAPSAVSVPSCSATGNALVYTAGVGFSCVTGYAPLASPTFTSTWNASTSNSSFAYVPNNTWQQYGPGGGTTSYTDGLISQTNPGSHTSYNNSAFAVLSSVVGSGVNGPAAADEGLSITAAKQNWPSSTVLGEVDGLSVITRNGQDDTCGICVNSGNVAGFSAILEGVDSQFAPTTGTVLNQVDVQLGAIETGLTGTAGSTGFIATVQAGTMQTGLLLQSVGGSSWTNAIMVNPNGVTGSVPTAASFLVVPSGQTTLQVTSGPSLVLNAGNNTGVGADIQFIGNGSTTPQKSLRVYNGIFQVVNNAASTAILSLTDAGNLAVTGSIQPSTTGGIIGTTLGDSANAGSVGEVVTSDIPIGSPVALTTNTAANITSVSLSAGDWVCSGTASFIQTATTTLTSINAGTSTTTGTLPLTEQGGYASINTSFASGSSFANVLTVGNQIYNVTTATTVYLVAKAVFSASTESAYGKLSCTRFR